MRHLLRFCVLALLVVSAPVQGADNQGLFSDVARSHWSYEAVDQLERQGLFTGYPSGTFANTRRALTRYEFAVALQRMFADVQRDLGPHGMSGGPRLRWAVIQRLGLSQKPFAPVEALHKLAQEFTPELAMLGSDPDQVMKNLQGIVKPEEAGLLPPRPEQPSAEWLDGAKQAREEWEQGSVTLYTYGFPGAGPNIDPMLGIPYKGIAGCIVDQRIIDLAAGHNEEVYRLILERGLPSSSRRPWLDIILKPASVWHDPKVAPARLDPAKGDVISPDGQVRLRWKPAEAFAASTLEVRAGERKLELHLYTLLNSASYLDVLWGPAKADLLFLRFPEKVGDREGNHYFVVDLRTGKTLHREFTELPNLQG